MNSLKNDLTFTVPLTPDAHKIAQKFHQQQSNSQKAKQIYLNTLAVYAVNFYLGCLGIETELDASDSWHPVMQTLADTADLCLKNGGKLECRPVLPDAQVCCVPPEVCSDRIGYVAVQLNHSLTEATLVGFLPEVVTTQLPLNQFQSLETLLEHLNPSTQSESVNLRQWLQNVFDAGWQTMESLFEPPQTQLAYNFRTIHSSTTSPSTDPTTAVKRGKRLDMGRRYDDNHVALCVGLKPTDSSELDISVEVYPTDAQAYLPRALQLIVLDEQGAAVMQAEARSTKHIQLEFSGEPGERFGVRVALGDVSITEAFLI
ncbi:MULTISPECIES: DUF1822 family protein [unclassified Coleofasciculus]|uniref:DUF1822 family protein n=1 Tax=unclassified Coleofasciculus TaxID=2692782 RepID=UPI00188207B3|nr:MULTISPECIES: DUF1822 family protein [unclassified Coleofasciculus]MBE9128034.1 DUF1822 family protein [Coleofasciculus sp. LEGE 07081]MBE9151131.1 DUF1822 family protein [Coleofasciculus sp. LEGE 07092]